MSRPTCPNCREGMSFAEAGFDGLWSCIYCEGTLLSASQITSLALAGGAQPFSLTMAPPQSRQARHDLHCPCGVPHSFVDLVVSASNVAYCTSCQSMFFRKGVLKELAPQAGAGGGAPLAMMKTIASGVAVVAMSVFGGSL